MNKINTSNELLKSMTDEAIEALRRRNEARVKEAVLKMGERYLLHPSNEVQRKTYYPVLGGAR